MPDNYFTPYEESREAERNIDISTGQRVFCCMNQDRNGSWAPIPGDSRYTDGLGWPSCWEDDLICTKVKYDYDGPEQEGLNPEDAEFSYCRLIATYTGADKSEKEWDVKSHGEINLLETGVGKRFASDGRISDQSRVIPISADHITASKTFDYSFSQIQTIRSMEGCVNANPFQPPWGDVYYAGYCLFLCADIDYYRDKITKERKNRITFHFLRKSMDHNLFWRTPFVDSELGFWDKNIPADYPYVDLIRIFSL